MQRQTAQLLKLKMLQKESIAEYQAEQISELESKRMEITSEEQNKVKRMKRTEDNLRGTRTISNAPTFQYLNYRGPRRRREKERV